MISTRVYDTIAVFSNLTQEFMHSILFRKLKQKFPALLFDSICIPLSLFLAYAFRYNMNPFAYRFALMDMVTITVMLFTVQTACYFYFKIYRGLWRYFSFNDAIRIIKAVSTCVLIMIPLFYLSSLLQFIPRSVPPLYGIILISLLCAGRTCLRLYSEKWSIHNRVTVERILIVGAGKAGQGLVRDLKRSGIYLPLGFVDDKQNKHGMEVDGVPVLGSISQLPILVEKHDINLIVIAIPSARSATMRTIVSWCEKTRIPFRILPGIDAFVSGLVSINALRPVNIEDLLGRDEVMLQWDKIRQGVYGKRVLLTGAGGSIGSELCRQIAGLNPDSLILVENSEFNLYEIHRELTTQFPNLMVHPVLLSVTDETGIKRSFKEYQPEIVFHAAAYKHVPMLENQVRVAVMNNVIGTQIVAQASAQSNVEKFVLVSTDKAVNPSNVMGTTKRVAEIYCQNLNTRVHTEFITVRFGNVLGSAGSVVPLFQKQLETGGPITVTHPDIERYFMTIPEACQLILQATVNGSGGEIFVLDMGEPVKIRYLAEQLIRLAGKEPDIDIKIQYTGLRPGEKLYEELFHEKEQLIKTEHEKLFQAQFRKLEWEDLNNTMHMLSKTCLTSNEDELVLLLKSLVPEFRTSNPCMA